MPDFVLRAHRPGDLGWIVFRHGELYAREYGWGARFEALVAEIAARFLREFDAARESCWIAERDGERIGSVCVVRIDDAEAKLRLLLVEPSARGLGVGAALIDACVGFARAAGYRRLTLWTDSALETARRLYAGAGFRCVRQERDESYAEGRTAEIWMRDL